MAYTKFLSTGRRQLYVVTLILISLAFILYLPTFYDMYNIWITSETYAHGIVILPICIFLLWRHKAELKAVSLSPTWIGVIALAGLSLVWFLATLISINLFQQISAVLILVAIVIACLGLETFRRFRFPLLYSLFAVPVGEFLVPYLQDYTAEFTVNTLTLMGYPVYLEGKYFYIPSGQFEVSAACSGVRYLIAAIALGSLYAYVGFKTLRNRLIIVGLATVLPVIANGIRAVFIVLLVDASSHKWGTGLDHLYYGWVFFAIVMLILVFIGSRLREPVVQQEQSEIATHAQSEVSISNNYPVLLLSFIALSIGPILIALIYTNAKPIALHERQITVDSWISKQPGSEWRPEFKGANQQLGLQFDKEAIKLTYQGGYKNTLNTAAELVDTSTHLVETDWKVVGRKLQTIGKRGSGQSWQALRLVVRSNSSTRIIYYYYDVSGSIVNSRLKLKLLELLQILTGQYQYTAVHWFQFSSDENLNDKENLVRDYMTQFTPENLVKLK